MTNILWCGAEDIDFMNALDPLLVAGSYDASYARTGITGSTGGVTIPQVVALSVPFPGGPVTSCWLHFRSTANTTATVETRMVGLTKATKTAGEGLWLKVDNPRTKIALCTWDGTTAVELATEAGGSIGASSDPYTIDMNLVDYGAAATVTVYVDGVQALTFTGDVRIASLTSVDTVALFGDSGSSKVVFSELIVADDDTRDMRLATLVPASTGDTTFTGNHTTIDDSALNLEDSAFANVNDAAMLVGLGSLPAGSLSVKALHIVARAAKSSGSTPTKLALGVKSGTVDDGTGQTLLAAHKTYTRLMNVNPVTSAAWTRAQVNAMNVQLKALA